PDQLHDPLGFDLTDVPGPTSFTFDVTPLLPPQSTPPGTPTSMPPGTPASPANLFPALLLPTLNGANSSGAGLLELNQGSLPDPQGLNEILTLRLLGPWSSGATGPGEISGRVFVDYNTNGRQEAGEPPLAGQIVYLDLNDNNRLDPGEPWTTTNAKGEYRF